MVSDKELDDFIEGELKKDITQADKVDDSVDQHLGEMGFLWERLQNKLQEDKVCFKCKKTIDLTNKEKPLQVLEATSEKGVIAFCSICYDCSKIIEKEQKDKEKDEVKKNE